MQKTNKQKTRQLKPTQIYFRNAAANQNMRRRFKTGNTVRQQIAGGKNRKTKTSGNTTANQNVRKCRSNPQKPTKHGARNSEMLQQLIITASSK